MAKCVGCSCTDNHACDLGCWWIIADQGKGIGVCSNCETADNLKKYRDQRKTLLQRGRKRPAANHAWRAKHRN